MFWFISTAMRMRYNYDSRTSTGCEDIQFWRKSQHERMKQAAKEIVKERRARKEQSSFYVTGTRLHDEGFCVHGIRVLSGQNKQSILPFEAIVSLDAVGRIKRVEEL